MQSLAVVQETPSNGWGSTEIPGLAVGWTVQVVPFQLSANGAPWPWPTAVQLFAAGHEIASRLPSMARPSPPSNGRCTSPTRKRAGSSSSS